jgi:hypothetical protein
MGPAAPGLRVDSAASRMAATAALVRARGGLAAIEQVEPSGLIKGGMAMTRPTAGGRRPRR